MKTLIIILALFISTSAKAAEVWSEKINGGTYVYVQGNINLGDAEKLEYLFGKAGGKKYNCVPTVKRR